MDFLHELRDDRGGRWVKWTLESASQNPDLRQVVESFEGVAVPAGQRAAEWLRRHALINHPSTVTQLYIVDRQLEAFVALCSATVKLSQRHRKEAMGGERVHELIPIQPAVKLAWLGSVAAPL